MTFFQRLSTSIWQRATIAFTVPAVTGTVELTINARVRQVTPSPYALQRLAAIGAERESFYVRGWYETQPAAAIRQGRVGRITLWDGRVGDWHPDGQQQPPYPLIEQIAGYPISGWVRFK